MCNKNIQAIFVCSYRQLPLYIYFFYLCLVQVIYDDFYYRYFAQEDLIVATSVVTEFTNRDRSLEELIDQSEIRNSDQVKLPSDFFVQKEK